MLPNAHVTAVLVVFCTSCLLPGLFLYRRIGQLSLYKREHPRRHLLPKNLAEWRALADLNEDNDDDFTFTQRYLSAWAAFKPLFTKHGITLWGYGFAYRQKRTTKLPSVPNTIFIWPLEREHLGNVNTFQVYNGLMHAADCQNLGDVVLRVMAAGGEGENYVRIMRRLSKAPDVLSCDNHVVPLIREIVFEDITIGVFPRISCSLQSAMNNFEPRTSVGDYIDMILQALEGVAYIHSKRIAHRDLFLNNFVVDWMPQSLRDGVSVCRPRVYIIDFELAVDFPADAAESDLCCQTHPCSGQYGRPMPPELEKGEPYNPFLLDVWQLGSDLVQYCITGISEVDTVWNLLISERAEDRPTAKEALQRVGDYIRSVPPSALHIAKPNIGEVI